MIIKLKNTIPVLAAVVLLIVAIIAAMIVNNRSVETISETPAETSSQISSFSSSISSASNYIPQNKFDEMRAVWIPYMSLSMSSADCSEQSFINKFDAIVAESKKCGFNTLIVHVRPFADALYKSNVFPWSHILTGTQGTAPEFDPLEYMVKKSHEEGLQLHAWVNPLRIQTNSSPSLLSSINLYNVWKNDSDASNDDYICEVGSDKYFNPAYMQVQSVIISGIKEIVSNYDVDGIQFDDYFYPTQEEGFDKNAYENYCLTVSSNAKSLSLLEWRTNNINLLISGVYNAIKSINSSVVFGISPQCNTQNDVNMGADIYTWGSTAGYVDYLCPQLYVSLNHPVLPFEKAADEWENIVTNKNIKLYYGLAVYKAGSDADSGTWLSENSILKSQVEYGRSKNCSGFMFYSYEYLNTTQTHDEVQNVISILK